MIDYEDHRINGGEIDLFSVYAEVERQLHSPPNLRRSASNDGGLDYLKLVLRLAPTGVHSSQLAAVAIATALDISSRAGGLQSHT